MRLCAAVAVWIAVAGPARADSEVETRARGHYEIGLGLYRLGDYRAALKEFAAGYALVPKAGFLLNLGQTYRKLGQLRDARDKYRQFLTAVPAGDPQRPQAEKVLSEIEETLQTQPQLPDPPPPPPAEPTATTTTTTTAAPAPAVVAERATPTRQKKRLRLGGIVLAVAGVGLVGGGIGTSVLANGAVNDLNKLDQTGGAFDPSKDDAYKLDRTLSAVFFGVGGALVATGIVLVIVASR
ncbi:MAG: TonB-dependent receptor [Myxococcales bacterium]|nr:TonB-dependent receptor [Myxococcales bacterium]